MKVVERSVSGGDRAVFDLDEFLSRPLFAHLAHWIRFTPHTAVIRDQSYRATAWAKSAELGAADHQVAKSLTPPRAKE